MPVTAPLDKVPAIPAKLVSIITNQVNKLLSDLTIQILDAVEKSVRIPDQCNSNDPQVQAALKSLQDAQLLVAKIQQLLPLIQTIVTTVTTIVTTAQAIKAAQLLNPVTAPAVIAAELVVVQNMTIANATIAIQQLKNIPSYLDAALGPLQSKLADIVSKLSPIVGNIPVDQATADAINNKFNPLTNLADEMLKQQEGFLTSIEEAPSKVFTGNGEPDPVLGKQGDYYINLTNNQIFGPKLTRTSWTDSELNYDVESFALNINIAEPVAPNNATDLITATQFPPIGFPGTTEGEYQNDSNGNRYRWDGDRWELRN